LPVDRVEPVDDDGMFDWKHINSPVKIGNGKALMATKIGKLRCTIIQRDGTTVNVTLYDVKFVPELWINLFSIGKALSNGYNIGNNGVRIFLTKNERKITFDRIMTTNKGFVMGVKMLPSTSRQTIAPLPMLERGKKLNVSILHGMLGHPGKETTRKIAAFYGWQVTGKSKVCDHCITAKAKQARIAKSTNTKSNKPGKRIFIDISSVKGESYGSSKFWLLALDDKTDQPFSFFLNKKSETKDKLVPWIKDLKSKHKIEIKFIRCDNAGENVSLEKACLVAGLGIQFKYTSAGTPQFNGRIERKFATLCIWKSKVHDECGEASKRAKDRSLDRMCSHSIQER
jgi:hypothetical protein